MIFNTANFTPSVPLGQQKVLLKGQGLSFGVGRGVVKEQILEISAHDQNSGEAHDLLKRFLDSWKGRRGQRGGPSDT